ncbi:uracil phosphoribosyltransferase [Agarilytica rhodophyticola]|uniref:uracil phosphoribosyltransferase n=1 Tax=Agarilytica rhodophyticola TaxID=1737490 RepID=UPI000B3413DE|nr:uracil phosphoribosyltransferase [Agarilytica rhodophyticola]
MTKLVNVVKHPLVQHKLSIMREKQTKSPLFRSLLNDVSKLLAYEVTHNMPLTHKEIETPLTSTSAPYLECQEICLVSILRAGNGLLSGMLELIPEARVGHVGLYRDPTTHEAVEYYFKMPPQIEECDTIVVDPMLATGHSAVAAMDRIKSINPKSLKFVCLLAAPEGIDYFHEHHPDIPIYTAAVDECLNERKYIIPGLGDAGDRMYGTQ